MARVRVLTMKFPRVTKIGQSIASKWARPGDRLHCTFQVPSRARPGPSLPLPTGLGPPESSTGPSPVDTFTLPPFLSSRARPGSSPYHGLCYTHITDFVTPVAEYWIEQEISQWVHHEGSIRRPIAP